MAKPFAWDDAAVESLKSMLSDGMSASEIAVALGVMSRNAVIGKVHRLGLAFARSHGQHEVSASANERPPRTKPAAAPKPPRERAPRAEKPRGILPAGGLPKDPEARRDVFCAVADKANERFAETIAAVGAGNEGVRFLDRGLYQCAMMMPGWDDAPVELKRVCGKPVRFRPCDFGSEPTSYCAACTRIVYAPPTFKAFKDRSMGVSA